MKNEEGQANVIFHIYSLTGVRVIDFLGYRGPHEMETGRAILFEAGSEFMVCKVDIAKETREDGTAAVVTHIYLRNV